MTGVLRKRETDIGKMPCDHSSRDWSKLSTTKESQRLLGTNRNLEEARKHPPQDQREREERKGGGWWGGLLSTNA